MTAAASYAQQLRRFHFRPTLRHPWAIVGRTRRVQGWKLHLSSVQVQAPDLLDTVVPILRESRVSFKVAQNDDILALLNEGDLGSTQVGKFLTVYPETDELARRLAERLIAATASFVGPEIVTDMRLGSVVYARYGSFSPIIKRNRLGYHEAMIETGDRLLVPDKYAIPFEEPAGVANPFAGFDHRASTGDARQPVGSNGKLIGPGYLIVRPLKVRAAGGAVLAIDLRSQDGVALKVVKFGRRHCLSDAQGRDIRDRLKRQVELHTTLAPRVSIPIADPYFEDDLHGYAAFQHMEGRDFEHVRARTGNQPWHCLSARMRRQILRLMVDAIAQVQALHTAGYVHRDLSPANLWVAPDRQVSLLDLELAFPIGGTGTPFGLGTEGFMSPQQRARQRPIVADDVFALGAVLTFLLGGLDPRRILFDSDRYREARLTRLIRDLPSRLRGALARALDPDPEQRPTLGELRETVDRSAAERIVVPSASQRSAPALPFSVRNGSSDWLDQIPAILKRGQRSLLAEADQRSGLWLSSRSSPHSDRSVGVYEIERHANRGVAGVAYLLARLARFGYANRSTGRAVARAVRWLVDSDPGVEGIPGLHFGEAGVAVTIAEAIAEGFVKRDRRVDAFLKRSLSGTLDWPDMTHGAAGQGVAALYCADRLRDPRLRVHVHACADYLLRAQGTDGSWTLPPGIAGMSGQTLTGFAHGTAGIVWFLAEYGRRFGDGKVARAIRRAKHWLIGCAVSTDRGRRLEWPYSTETRQRWHWWCHGGPGIALTFLKLYQISRDECDAQTARRALRAHPSEVRYANLTQCHGTSGLGEIYLEAVNVLGEDEWRRRAESIGTELLSLARETDAGLVWFAEDPHQPTADLMVGYSGVLHFLLRLHSGRRMPGFPLLLDVQRG